MKLRFEDCSSRYPQPDPFELLDDRMLAKLGLENPLRRIELRPVTTKNENASIAFFGLNAYCGQDYEEASVQPNFVEWCQDRYNGKLQAVIELYMSNLPLSGSAYFSNYFKVVLPQGKYKKAADLKPLMSDTSIIGAMDSLLRTEVECRINSGCRIFVVMGNDAYRNFMRCIRLNQEQLICSEPRIVRGEFNGQSIIIAKNIHFSRYRKADTNSVIRELKRLI